MFGASIAMAHSYLIPHSAPKFLAVLMELSVVMLFQMFLCFALGAVIGSMEAMLPGNVVGLLAMVLPFLSSRSLTHQALLGTGIGASVFLLFSVWDVSTKDSIQEYIAKPERLAVVPVARRTLNTPPWLYDVLEYAGSRRRAPVQRQLFARMGHNVLFAAAGTGLNFTNFPPSRHIVAVDLNQRMVRAARLRAQKYHGELVVQVADLHELPFRDASFDTVATASTFCSVPDPIRALQELHRVLIPGGKLLMFEHVRSRNWLIGGELDALNRMMRFLGPVMVRNTVALVQSAGFTLDNVRCGYLDVFLCIEAHKPAASSIAPSLSLSVIPTAAHFQRH